MAIRTSKRSGCRNALLVTALVLTVWATARGERLPLKAYTTANGLAHNGVNKIVRDSRGFLWFCTNEGLARFDGYTFTNYGTNEGLPHPTVKDIVETREGDYWVATNGGLCKFNPRGASTSTQSTAAAQWFPGVRRCSPSDRVVIWISIRHDSLERSFVP